MFLTPSFETLYGDSRTSRLILRKHPVTRQHAQTVFEAIERNKLLLMPWLTWVKEIRGVQDVYEFLEKSQARWENEETAEYGIFLKADGHRPETFIGCICVERLNFHDACGEVAYWLDSLYTGHGYMVEAVHMIENAFFGGYFNRLIIACDSANTASAHVAEKAGFILEGVERKSWFMDYFNDYRDAKIYSKLRSDWLAEQEQKIYASD